MRKQSGVSLLGLLVIGVMVACTMLLGFKLVPAYTEYFSVKKVLTSIANEQRNSGPEEIRKAFDRHATIDDINSFKAEDLDIEQGKEGLGISVAYDKSVPLFSNIYVLIKFQIAAGTAAGATPAAEAEKK